MIARSATNLPIFASNLCRRPSADLSKFSQPLLDTTDSNFVKSSQYLSKLRCIPIYYRRYVFSIIIYKESMWWLQENRQVSGSLPSADFGITWSNVLKFCPSFDPSLGSLLGANLAPIVNSNRSSGDSAPVRVHYLRIVIVRRNVISCGWKPKRAAARVASRAIDGRR